MPSYKPSHFRLLLRSLILQTGLTVLIIGSGAGSRINPAKADDVFIAPAQEKAAQDEKEKARADSKAAQQDKARAEQDKVRAEADDERARQELESLLKERAKLDERIAATREKMSGRRRFIERSLKPGERFPFIEVKPGDGNAFILRPEIRANVDEAMKKAQKAMEEAFKNGNNRVFVVPPVNGDAGQNRAFRFFWNGKDLQGGEWKDAKPGQTPEELRQHMQEMRRHIEQMMRDMEQQLNRAFDNKNAPRSKAPNKEEKKEEPKDKPADTPVLLDV